MQRVKNFSLCIIGSFLYCIGTNIFIIPANLYSGGFVGIAQLIVPYFLIYHFILLEYLNLVNDLLQNHCF